MSVTPEGAAADRLRQKIGNIHTSELPIEIGRITDMIILQFMGTYKHSYSLIKNIATTEFGLTIDDKGRIALPQSTIVESGSKIEILYKGPIYISGIPPLLDDQPYRKFPKKDKGQE